MTRTDTGERRAGLVLAGGYSRRFGATDKAFATLDGRPLVEHVLERLGRVVDGLLVSVRDEQLTRLRGALRATGISVGAVPDPVPGRGPAAGIAAGLAPCRATYAAVLACDTPLVDPGFLSGLFERARGCDGAVPRIDGRLRPTLAVYRTAAIRTACERSLASGDGSLRGAVDALDATIVPHEAVANGTDPSTVLDINEPADLRRAEERLDR